MQETSEISLSVKTRDSPLELLIRFVGDPCLLSFKIQSELARVQFLEANTLVQAEEETRDSDEVQFEKRTRRISDAVNFISIGEFRKYLILIIARLRS